MNSFWLFLILLLFTSGCKVPSNTKGPLEGFDEYRVTLFVSPYSEFDSKEIAKSLKTKLLELGEVREASQNRNKISPLLLISIEKKDSPNPSSIRVIGQVNIQKNDYELTRVIWSYPHEPLSEDSIIEKDGLVSFPEKKVVSESSGDTLDILFNAFIKEFVLGNSSKSKPIFLIPIPG